jgi:transposase
LCNWLQNKRAVEISITLKSSNGKKMRNETFFLSSEILKATRFSHPVCLDFNPLSPELNPICYLLALLVHDFLHVIRIRVKSLTLR